MDGHAFFKIMLAVGFLAALLVYLVARKAKGKSIELEHVIEAPLCGCAIAAGIHLAICAYFPEHLVEHFDSQGHMFHLPDGVTASMDTMHFMHFMHVAAGGVATVFLGIAGITRAISR